ncbi:hypothetical protein K493DRAFT_287477 [Basidiobolus meristosporus CBS 931.73]|uniref:Tyrosine specific protein phosphatases domain-containing protein n=1 Tax=Basidiobolus meristosporus CBS 931.73 TaxID=1314790 RepID=A0A1Y1XYU2_9FUNG|nr:hypothetical protein K493DRAFT_287477 [Basidiobolus meristosporus CBS 931.73]|eukprot:ORX90892.1 hypothetical protein K493DRAFT_287477 [Basidiobolus meristosporus CBS 931.73]
MTSFSTVHNFRDIGIEVNTNGPRVLKENILFRSARLDEIDEKDLQVLVNEKDIKTILDLRTEAEGVLNQQLSEQYPIDVLEEVKEQSEQQQEEVLECVKASVRRTIKVNLTGYEYRYNAVWKRASVVDRSLMVFYYLCVSKMKAYMYVVQHIIGGRGLLGLNQDYLDFSGAELCKALSLFVEPKNYPILVHCTHGKDRTGLITALVLMILGVEDDVIIRDYSKSREQLEGIAEALSKEVGAAGVSPNFLESNPEVMADTLSYIRNKYGGINEYLDGIGFGEAKRALIRQNILV